MSDLKPPSIGSTRCMIYRFQRVLIDGCLNCRLSVIACHFAQLASDRTCCTACRHDGM